jgi:hypothetical protein
MQASNNDSQHLSRVGNRYIEIQSGAETIELLYNGASQFFFQNCGKLFPDSELFDQLAITGKVMFLQIVQ